MARKVGPLPLWAWLAIAGGVIGLYLLHRSSSSSSTANANQVDPSSPTGATYAQEAQDAALGVDPVTGETYAQEQAQAASNAYQAAGAGGGGSNAGDLGSAGVDTSGLSAQLAQVDADIQALPANLAASQPLTDGSPTPGQDLASEISDIEAGISAVQSLPGLGAPVPATTTRPAAPRLGKSAIRLPFGPTKPTAPHGYKAVGQGNGYWEAVPVTRRVTVNRPPAPKAAPKPEKRTEHGTTHTIKRGRGRR